MKSRLGRFSFLVPDYDEAIAFFTEALGFTLVEDSVMSPEKRWVVVRGEGGAELVLAKAVGETQRARIGDQHGGRVGFFLYVDDFAAARARIEAFGCAIHRETSREAYGTVAVFRDPWGNLWDLIEPSR